MSWSWTSSLSVNRRIFSAHLFPETPHVPSPPAKAQMLTTVPFFVVFIFLFFLDCFGAAGKQQLNSSCWEFAWRTLLWNIQAGGRAGGLLCALTSPTAPGNASHSSSWQLLGHFQKTRGKKHSGIIFWSIWEPRAEGAKEARLKTHGGLFFCCFFFCFSVRICGFSTSPSSAPPDTSRRSLQRTRFIWMS